MDFETTNPTFLAWIIGYMRFHYATPSKVNYKKPENIGYLGRAIRVVNSCANASESFLVKNLMIQNSGECYKEYRRLEVIVAFGSSLFEKYKNHKFSIERCTKKHIDHIVIRNKTTKRIDGTFYLKDLID